MKLSKAQRSMIRDLVDMKHVPVGCYHTKTWNSLRKMGLIVADDDSHEFVKLTSLGKELFVTKRKN